MSKRGRMMIIMIAIVVQVIISMLYGFSNIQMPAMVCFGVWCTCAVTIYRFAEAPEIV